MDLLFGLSSLRLREGTSSLRLLSLCCVSATSWAAIIMVSFARNKDPKDPESFARLLSGLDRLDGPVFRMDTGRPGTRWMGLIL